MPRLFCCAWATSLLLAIALPANANPVLALSAAQQEMVDGMLKLDGHTEYQNVAFGFGVMPGVTTAYQGNGTDDGVLIPLGDDREITVNAGYDAAMLGSTKALMDSELSEVDPGGVQRQPFVLDSQPAEQAQWADGQFVRRVIVEYRSTGPDDGVNYTLRLRTDAAHQQADGQAFDAVVKSFKHYQIEND
ncbi:hypothetical protein PMM47T1_21638 [Pseudomonas sp. M47T1]|uniref:hypothetical protein n=1 Tax=unclassified Pseudomonas TaxID=196821 RepID=UPI0002606FF4|nr:hypothetical protein [Pseudomonas sp. M47T1]EIK94537.1 hypothetical protein PMM47T1_21638 [Pseudomonas sp. M47T1]